VLGGIGGAAATTALASQLAGSATGNLMAAAAGAAIAPLATHFGRWRRFGLGLALTAIAIALVLTYGSAKVVDATAETKTFPPLLIPDPTAAPTPDPTPDPPGVPDIRVTPTSLRCTSAGCDDRVLIESTGSASLRIFDIDVKGDAKDRFRAGDNCQRRTIRPGERCAFSVSFTPASDGSTVSAELVIHQNLKGDPTVVALEGSGPPGGDLAFERAACALDDGARGHVDLTVSGPDGTAEVPVRLRLVDGSTQDANVAVGVPAAIPFELAAPPSGAVPVTVLLDPEAAIAEPDEDNNLRELTCAAPDTGKPTGPHPAPTTAPPTLH
jgi:hypothetical protein